MLEKSIPEIQWLVFTVSLTAIMWLPYILNRIVELGILTAIWDPQGDTAAKAAWANRMMSAHVNAVENLAIFAPLVILIVVTGRADEITALAVQVYFFARLAHYFAFTFAVPVLRIATFLAGFAAQVMLVLTLLY